MKINFILPGLGDSGGIKVVEKYTDILNKRGHDIIIYCSLKSTNLHRYNSKILNIIHQVYCTGKTIPYILIKRGKNSRKWVWNISDKSIREADCTIATMWSTAYQVRKLSKKCGEKYYFVQDYEIWDNYKMGRGSYMLPLKKIVISTWINKTLEEELGIGPFPIVLNGIDIKKYCNIQKVYKEKREPLQFLMLNHRLKKKGISNGLKVFEKIKGKYPDIKLKMFGMCPRANLPEYVDYIQNPTQELIVQMYSTSDIFIFPSLEEGWGLTPLEAMACKCAVVGTRTGFVLDLGRHKDNMMISEPGNLEEMETNIIELIDNPSLLKKISMNGYETAKKLDWMLSAKKLEELLVR